MNLLVSMNLSRRLLNIEKKILPMVFVSAIGRNSAGLEVCSDFERRRTEAEAQLGGTSLLFHTFEKIACKVGTRAGHRL